MATSPQELRDAVFGTVKRGGYDPAQVDAFKAAAADALQRSIQDATAMEARARAAVARLQELSQQQPADAAPAPVVEQAPEPRSATVDESETISRTLLLAQRTADATVADAHAEAEGIVEAARAEARRSGEAERVRVEGEVQALLARRDFLESDVDQLEQHLVAQRDRIAGAAADLGNLANGLALDRRPQLSASDQAEAPVDEPADEPDVAALIDEVVETVPEDSSAEIARVDSLFEPDDQR